MILFWVNIRYSGMDAPGVHFGDQRIGYDACGKDTAGVAGGRLKEGYLQLGHGKFPQKGKLS